MDLLLEYKSVGQVEVHFPWNIRTVSKGSGNIKWQCSIVHNIKIIISKKKSSTQNHYYTYRICIFIHHKCVVPDPSFPCIFPGNMKWIMMSWHYYQYVQKIHNIVIFKNLFWVPIIDIILVLKLKILIRSWHFDPVEFLKLICRYDAL